MKLARILFMALALGLLITGCSQQEDLTAPQNETRTIDAPGKDGTEFLGEITIAAGSGFAEGGVGMVDTDTGTLDIMVPVGATVEQVLLYWMGGTTAADGDNEIEVDGNPVTGVLIGGPTNFFGSYNFRAYRADVTAQNWVVPGANSFTITGMDFVFASGALDENNGAGMIVIYDDGTAAELQLFDGLDMAFFQFSSTLNATVPITFDFAAEPADRMGKFVVLAGSVGADRPNQITATTSAGVQTFDNALGSLDGMLFDSITLEVLIPAGDTQLTAQLFSVASETPLGASLGWLGTGLSVPVTPPPELACLGDFVWHDMNMDGIQDTDESGIEGVTAHLMDCNGQVLATAMTDTNGYYMFCDLEAGDYSVHFVLPDGYEFSPQDQGGDDAIDSDADPASGSTACTTLDPGENDLTWDAGLYMPELACLGDFVWNDLDMDGIQDTDENGIEGVYVDLMDCNGQVLDSTMTDINGYYMFCDLEPGDYSVHFVLPDGYVFSPQDQGADDAMDSDADPVTGNTTCATLDSGETNLTLDAGLFMPDMDCGECDGKITELTLRFHGDETGNVEVFTKGKDPELLFEGMVNPGEDFSFVGNDRHGTMGPEIHLFVDGELNTKIHTSCSQPIGVGLVSGAFEIVAGASRNGGALCPIDTPPGGGDDDGECDGKMTQLTLRFNGDAAGHVEVFTKGKAPELLFEGMVDPGEEFSFVGNDRHGTMGPEIHLFIDGELNTKIHTSCSQPIYVGMTSGAFEIMAGRSRNGGDIGPLWPTLAR